jgi:MFS family permease
MSRTLELPDWRTLGALPSALLGAVIGIAWAAALRGWMAELAGHSSEFDWLGTFALILLPGAVVGLLLGLADHARRTGGRPGWRWLALAPLILGLAPQLVPGAFEQVITTGIGGAAIGVALFGILGGVAVSRRGPLWLRIVCGLLALAFVVTAALFSLGLETADFGAIAGLELEPRATWVAVTVVSLMIVFAFACSIPHRRIVTRSPYRRSSENGATT